MNFCVSRGCVGGARDIRPVDPRDFNWRGRRSAVVCSNLACSACGVVVRCADGCSLDGRKWLKKAYAADNLSQAPGVCRGFTDGRLYVCRCRSWEGRSLVGLALSDLNSETRLELPETWSCAGHPVFELPACIDGVELPEQPAWEALLCDLSHRPATPEAPHRWQRWLDRVFGMLSGTPHQTALDETIIRSLDSTDPAVCARALKFAWGHLDSQSPDHVFALLVRRGNWLRAQPNSDSDGPNLYAVGVRVLLFHLKRERWPYDGAVRELVRAHADDPGCLGLNAWFWVKRDHAWFLANQERLLAAWPEATEKVEAALLSYANGYR